MASLASRGRLKLDKWSLRVLAEIMVRGEEYKPFQVAKRMVVLRYGLAGTSKDRVFTALAYNTWRLQGVIDRVIESVLGLEVGKLNPWLRALLRLYTYQRLWAHRDHPDMTWWMERYAPRVLEEVASRGEVVLWSRYVEKLRRHRPRLESVEARFLVSRTLYERLVGFIGRREAEKLLRFTLDWVPPIAFRVNRLKARVEEVLEELRALGAVAWRSHRYGWVVFARRGFNISGFRALAEGRAIVQDEPSAIASAILDPKPGHVVVDLCAAPGGKTTHLAELMEGRGVVYAFDLYPDRVKHLRDTVAKHGVETVVKVVMADARTAPRLLGEEVADRVLVDPPCSSSGTIAKNPDVRWRLTTGDLEKLTSLQEELLEAAIRLAKPGARILYTTCSILREEGEDIVERVLRRHPEVRLVPLNGPYDPSPVLPGTMRAWPHKHEVTGFFYALLEKQE